MLWSQSASEEITSGLKRNQLISYCTSNTSPHSSRLQSTHTNSCLPFTPEHSSILSQPHRPHILPSPTLSNTLWAYSELGQNSESDSAVAWSSTRCINMLRPGVTFAVCWVWRISNQSVALWPALLIICFSEQPRAQSWSSLLRSLKGRTEPAFDRIWRQIWRRSLPERVSPDITLSDWLGSKYQLTN